MDDHLSKTDTRHSSARYVFKKYGYPRAEARGKGFLHPFLLFQNTLLLIQHRE